MPSSVLRPYNDASDGVYVPVLLKSKYTSWIPLSNQLFLLHPAVVSILIALASAAAYYVNNLFQTVLVVPGDVLAYEDESTWKDSVASGIYAVPPVAAIIGALFALGNWYHTRLWKRYSDREARMADVVDIPTYYQHATSKFWCLEYESEIVAAWGVDGRNPAKPLQITDESRIPSKDEGAPAPTDDVTTVEETTKPCTSLAKPPNDDDDDEYDLALFRHSSTTGPSDPGNATTTLTALANLESATSAEPILQEADLQAAGPSYLPASFEADVKDQSSIAEIRHLTLSETYKPTKGVEGHILAIAVQSAFQTSDKIKHVLIRLDPKLDKAFRMHCLKGGFRILRNDIPLESGMDISGFKDAFEATASRVWPLGFETELLVLDKDKWQMPTA